jgi:hypothetical protein
MQRAAEDVHTAGGMLDSVQPERLRAVQEISSEKTQAMMPFSTI